MSARELVVLGTGSQVPSRYRAHHGCFLRWDNHAFLFDPGEGTQRQMTFAGVAASSLSAILITHFHGDHSLGLAGLVQRLCLDKVPGPFPIVYPASGQAYFERLIHATIYHPFTEIRPIPVAGDGVVWEQPEFFIEARRLDHRVEAYGYAVQERPGRTVDRARLEALKLGGAQIGRLVREGRIELGGRSVLLDEVSVPRPGQRFALVMDTRPCPGAEALAAEADLLVCESTYQDDCQVEAWERGHLTARQAGALARSSGARRLVLTHFSQRYRDNEGFVREAAEEFEPVVAVADLDRIPLPGRRDLTLDLPKAAPAAGGAAPTSVLFFHGLESGPGADKAVLLQEFCGAETPDHRGLDLDARVADGAALIGERDQPTVLVGSSIGGLVALRVAMAHPTKVAGLILLAPALWPELVPAAPHVPKRTRVLHGVDDEVVPIELSRRFCADQGIPLIELADGHRLKHQHAAILGAVAEVLTLVRQEVA